MQFDITFPALQCSIISVDVMDISGQEPLDVVCTFVLLLLLPMLLQMFLSHYLAYSLFSFYPVQVMVDLSGCQVVVTSLFHYNALCRNMMYSSSESMHTAMLLQLSKMQLVV